MLIEDERKIADFVCDGLGARGLSVEHVDNGHAGYERARRGAFDVIVLDIMLPGRDGLSVLAALRQQEIVTPVILLRTLERPKMRSHAPAWERSLRRSSVPT